MLVEEKYIKTIALYLGVLSEYIDSLSSINLHDTSVISENFCARLMNLVYGYDLSNTNHVKQNAEVIDLYDTIEKVSVQVTSNRKLPKVRGCLEQFIEKELHKEFNQLYVYILTSKQKSYKIEDVVKGSFWFDKKVHIIDKKSIISRVQGFEPSKQKKVLDLIKENIEHLPQDRVIASNEVETLINVVTIISEKVAQTDFDEESEIDPERKISKRFKDDSIIIDNQYFNLCCEYAPILTEVEQSDDYDSVKNSKVALYLKDKSTEILFNNNFDAMSALKELTSYVENLFRTHGVDYNETAIKFFVLKHLTQCNVFPLLRGESRCIN
ncbi:SMEK domain-containing protein [Vibrio lentus]|uniref:SMEK domain-containing protein n=1 Tax=Vibrio TaxID=662 RepID=UPI0002FBFFFD|nr:MULTISPECIES: SMEK domain-containing protein [Vibrio]OCH56901.1 hypothetical protein A6E08_19560 [Vibrio lentus]PMH90431.1 hypothetical protein BCU56_17230 [Vibrio lentus]PMI58248.1 hypothetical protein BCU41_23840 [Vibrio lentus]